MSNLKTRHERPHASRLNSIQWDAGMTDWHVGQKIVCIDAEVTPQRRRLANPWLRKNSIYTIREIIPSEMAAAHGIFIDFDFGFLLEEIVTQCYPCGLQRAFHPRRFRPIVEDRTQFSLLQSIADRVGKRVKVRA